MSRAKFTRLHGVEYAQADLSKQGMNLEKFLEGKDGSQVFLIPKPTDKYPEAISVCTSDGFHLGWIPAFRATVLSPKLQRGVGYMATLVGWDFEKLQYPMILIKVELIENGGLSGRKESPFSCEVCGEPAAKQDGEGHMYCEAHVEVGSAN